MLACPTCRRIYADEAAFCQADGKALAPAEAVSFGASLEDKRLGTLLAQRYRVFRVVADGGMGRVYEGLDTRLNRHVALKVLHPDVLRDGISVERFKREYAVGRVLHHEHIVAVSDFQKTGDGSYVLVLEFLVGEELRAVLKREGPMAPARAIRMMSQLALGLDCAHAKALVHRDLKPDNIFLCQTQEGDIVKVLDFGSVKDKGAKKQLTVMGTTIGSPFYMSPEQAQGLATVDHRTDVWALTAILYEVLTGIVPFKGNNGPAILFEILSKEPAPASEIAPLKFPVPPALDAVIARGLSKDLNRRLPDVGALADWFGRSYGLEGDHQYWATTPQSELDARVEKFSAPSALPPAEKAFFGPPSSSAAQDNWQPPDSASQQQTKSGLLRVLVGLAFLLGLALLALALYWLMRN